MTTLVGAGLTTLGAMLGFVCAALMCAAGDD